MMDLFTYQNICTQSDLEKIKESDGKLKQIAEFSNPSRFGLTLEQYSWPSFQGEPELPNTKF